MSIKSVAIVGAGMAGLTAALALAKRGIGSDVYEQAPQLGEVGAGLQVSPNASRILGALGLMPALESHWLEPAAIGLASGLTLKPLAALPAGDFARRRWGAPYGVLHRSTLQQVLLAAALREPLVDLHLAARVDSPAQALASDTERKPDLVIGADGVWSQLRSAVPGTGRISFSGNVAWRFTLPFEAAPHFLDPRQVTAFLGPQTHLVVYPLKEIGAFNMVAIAAGTDPGRSWETADEGHRRLMLRQFLRWDERIVDLIDRARQPNFWPLFQVSDGAWQNGRDTVLIGDAAHAMMPFAAQGAAMAIEDADLLAQMIATRPLATALPAFEAARRARIAKVRSRGAFNKFAYHARGPVRIGRDLVLSLRPPASLAGDLDWLYGYRSEG